MKNMVKQSTVNIKLQILCGIIPFVWIWALYRIEKIRVGIPLFLIGGFAVSIGFQIFVPFPYGTASAIIASIMLWIYFIRKWSIEWNRKISGTDVSS
jgi:hypothetical protein